MSKQQRVSPTNPKAQDPALEPGGYHSRGVPGEEARTRKIMRVFKIQEPGRTINRSRPVKGGGEAESTSRGRLEAAQPRTGPGPEGSDIFYVLARRDQTNIETPVWHAGESNEEEAVAIFTDPELAQRYIQTAGWEQTYETAELPLADLDYWLREAIRDGIRIAAIDPDREAHMGGEPQQALHIPDLTEQPIDTLYRELRNIAPS